MARIYRDAYAVPHVRATSLLDLAHGQGEVTARDRGGQLDWQRRRATGTTAEVVGVGGLPWDRLARRTRIADTARRAHAALTPETRGFVAAYVDGVNAGLGPGRAAWEEWTPLAVFLGQHLLFAGLGLKLFQHRVRTTLGDDAVRLLSHEGPESSGSNAWAVGGRRTTSGLPLIGGDPHRVIEEPGVYQQVRLSASDEGVDVVGFAFPGVPGVQHFAHAGEVAWAITNAMADYQDVYAEQLRRVGPVVEALGPDGWEPAEELVEEILVRDGAPEPVSVVTTARGPVFQGEVEEGHALSLRTSSGVLGELGFDALLPLLRARSVEDVDAALDHWVEPVNNAVVADRSGRVLYRIAGRVPVRAEANRRGIVTAREPSTAWTGWIDPPRHEVPAGGAVVTANERRGPESEAVGTTFAPPHRARRIRELLGERTDLDPAAFAAIHADVRLPVPDSFRSLLAGLPAGPVRDAILAWDGEMTVDSAGAAAYAAWRGALAQRITAAPELAALATPWPDEVLAPSLHLGTRVASALPALVAEGTPFGIDVAALAGLALVDAERHAPTWGDVHVLAPVPAYGVSGVPPVPVGGDSDCVRCTGSIPGVDDTCWRGSLARYVWDLADREAGGWVVPLGAREGDTDQLDLWTDVRLAPIVTEWDRLRPE